MPMKMTSRGGAGGVFSSKFIGSRGKKGFA
jgi:hypothetical protein